MNAMKRSDVVPAGGGGGAPRPDDHDKKRRETQQQQQQQQQQKQSRARANKSPVIQQAPSELGEQQKSSVASNSQQVKQVFGLNPRANRRAKLEQPVEQKARQQVVASGEFEGRQPTSGASKLTKPLLEDTNSSAKQAEQQTSPIVRPKSIRASKYGNFYKPQDVVEPPDSEPGKPVVAVGPQLGQGKSEPSRVSSELSPLRPTGQRVESAERSSSATRAKKMARRKSIEEDLSTNKIESCSNNSNNNNNTTTVQLKMRTQFNVLPPPQLTMATTGKGSVVSYAKSRIYDKPSKEQQHMLQVTGDSGGGGHSSSLLNPNGAIPASISSGFKPPKQVNVSKARKEWEGGEPFAKCKSRQRLAAKVAAAGHKKLLHGTWSMTSVVATQQLQLQQALAQSSAGVRSNVELSDPSVKVLTRGSVLERVQQFERAPSSSSSPPARSRSSPSLASSASGLEVDELVSLRGEQTGALSSGQLDEHDDHPDRPSSPHSKQAQYRTKIASIQQQQHVAEEAPVAAAVATGPSTKQAAGAASGQTKAEQPAGLGQQQRRLSLRRRSSLAAGAANCNSSQSIPKFYHPHGRPNTYEMELQKKNIVACFDRLPDRKAQLAGPNARRHFHSIALACGFSEYFKVPLNLYAKHWLENFDSFASMSNSNNNHVRKTSTVSMTNGNGATNTTTDNTNSTKLIRRSNSIASNQANMRQLQRAASVDSPTGGGGGGSAQTNNKLDSVQFISCDQFLVVWRQLISEAYDNSSKFIHLLTFGRRAYLLPDDFVPLVQSIIDDHPGLKFLRAAPDFHLRYIQTVIARFYYNINKSWTGKISAHELRRSNLLAVLLVLSQEEDINQITDYFSYEHFYVIYCKFWNLDQDHDLLISKEDLARHNDASISSRIIERIFSASIVVSSQSEVRQTGKMGYSDFVWFLLAEEDKKHPRAIEYWFRLMDLDGDGYISMYEMEYFYYEQMKRLELMNIEPLPFLDCACQILDLVNPKEKSKISLADLKRTKMAPIFFDTFINLEKYLEHESREFVSTRDLIQDGVLISDWDRYASEEYENLVTEESSV